MTGRLFPRFFQPPLPRVIRLYAKLFLLRRPRGWNQPFYERPDEMNGEEARCAAIIDSVPRVQYWVRNLEQRHDCSFWLPTSTDKFYPDFVAKLIDGRYLVVEYKGADRMDTADTKEKKMIGELWEARSNGRCVFHLGGATNMDQLIRGLGTGR